MLKEGERYYGLIVIKRPTYEDCSVYDHKISVFCQGEDIPVHMSQYEFVLNRMHTPSSTADVYFEYVECDMTRHMYALVLDEKGRALCS